MVLLVLAVMEATTISMAVVVVEVAQQQALRLLGVLVAIQVGVAERPEALEQSARVVVQQYGSHI